MQTLKVVVTDHWFDEIKSGRKTHEYRKASFFWKKRINGLLLTRNGVDALTHEPVLIEFQRAYRKNPERMTFKINGISVVWGMDTDLKIRFPVFDIELGERVK
ncbi:MAG: hypothetical protein IJY17_07375 [Alphaproteobacteria bacterium]|nr:hypothetical protein [Alphaproteobacteria bacterium]